MSVSSNRRYLSLWLRRLSTDRIERRSSERVEAFVVVASIKGAQQITALTDGAARLGLKVGLGLADARARYPSLPVVEVDFEADRRLLEAIADWCDRYTPLVGLDPPDGLLLDVTGCAHLFGGESAMARDLLLRLKHQGFVARAAVADTVGCAWGVARFGDFSSRQNACAPLPPRSEAERWGGVGGRGRLHAQHAPHPGSLRSPTLPTASRGEGDSRGLFDRRLDSVAFGIIPHGEAEAAALPLPIAALRVDGETVAGLKTAGLTCVGDLACRPRAPFAARFGKELLLRLDQALGRVEEPISPRLPVPTAMAEQRFPDPIAREADVLGTIEHLGGRLAEVLERRGEGGRLFQVALFRADGTVHRLEIGTGSPLRDPARVRKLFEERLAVLGDACDPGFGYDLVRLSALVIERTDPAQTGLAGPDHAEELAHLIDRLGARFGLRRVTRLMPQDTHIPEYAVANVPAHAMKEVASVPSPLEQDSLGALRPLRLFSKPQPIAVINQVPDGPPVKFRWMKEGDEWPEVWKQDWQQVASSEGPERIAMEWWRNDRGEKLARDYFRVENEAGARFWLYREGAYQSGKRVPRWYVHGLFA